MVDVNILVKMTLAVINVCFTMDSYILGADKPYRCYRLRILDWKLMMSRILAVL